MTSTLLSKAAMLLAEAREMGIKITPGMPVPEDEAHAQMAVHVLSQLISAHRAGRHTPYCTCGLA